MAVRNILKIVPTKFMIHCHKSFINYYSTIFINKQCNNILGKRTYITDESIITNEMALEQNDLEEMDEHVDKILIRNLLYKDSKDPLILQLNDSASVQNVFNIIRQNHAEMNPEHISQAVLVLWDLQKIFYKHNIYYESESTTNTLLSGNAILQNYMTQVNNHEDFETLIKLIEENYNKFTLEALTCTLLYLNRMGVKLKTNVMQCMIQRCKREIKNCDDIGSFPLTSLSRFVVTVYSQDSLYPILVTVGSMPIIQYKLDNCHTEEDFKLLTICMHKMKSLISRDILNKYKKLTEKLIQNNIVNKNNPRTIIKAVRFLNQLQWFDYNSECTKKLMRLLKGSINQLTATEVVSLFKVFQVLKEPADMLEEIQNHARNLLSKSEDNNSEITLDLVSCVVAFASPLERPKFQALIRQYIKNLTLNSISPLYKILYYVKSPDVEFYNYFWSKSFKLAVGDLSNMMNISQKYMHFSNNIGYRYRYFNFEKSVINYFNNELKSNILSLIPGKFVRIASFIIAYSTDYNYVEKILDQLLDMVHRFNSFDCLNVSKGLQILFENKEIRRNSNITDRIQLLKTALNDCIIKELNTNSDLSNVNILLRGYVMRKENTANDLFKTLIKYYVINCNELSSHIIRDTVFSLQINNCLVPEVINKIVDYIINKKESILGNTVDKVLHLCYSLGYYPDNSEEFFSTASEIIQRDKDRFSGLTFLQTCLALCFYQHLPGVLIKHIFSVQFLETLDQELANCYAKTTYPSRVRDHLMQLNRAVCMDYPEFKVPWFHQKYIDEIKKKSPKKDFFNKEVHSILIELSSENNQIVADLYTPYGYNIDFVTKSNRNENDTGTAILLLNSKAFTNHVPNLKGYYQLKKRHLEILGYNVIGLNYSEWKSFYTKENCTDYIKNKITYF